MGCTRGLLTRCLCGITGLFYPQYGIVLDAGSSHTNLYVYEWPAEKENDTGVVHQVEVCKVEGLGISGYSQDTEKAGLSLQRCMKRAQEVVPEHQHRETPVYLGATAGMRLLSIADRVLSAVEKTLRSSPFNFQGARVISGQEEGAYGWITINYLLGNFKQPGWLNFLPHLRSSRGTSGALDLGGASTQITFVPDQEPIESQENSLHFRLYGKNYKVYTHSFLCYGKDQALRLKLASDLQASNGSLLDPCFHPGYLRIMNISDLYTNPCIANGEQQLPFTQLHLQGNGDYQRCRMTIQKIFNTSHCPYSSCSFNGIFLPPLQGEFGVSLDARYTWREVSGASQACDNHVEQQASKVFVLLQVKAEFPKIKEKYLSEYCFSGTYILSLLENGYGFTMEKWQSIQFLGKIGSSDAGWTLGYMLNLTNMIPAEKPPTRPLSHASYYFLLVLSSSSLSL
uniref:Ectonucleoside triphosphate diphosphohydrolase 1 n=1 Tax=Chelonoidis abingdonii TaxID=106734 RepID=A0A8C0GSL6_CHEAB